MKVNRKKLISFLKKIKEENAQLTDEELIDKLSTLIEINPSSIETERILQSGRFTHSTVGYGIYSLLDEKYRIGRIEVHDSIEDNGYPIHEGFYCMPLTVATAFETFIDELYTDLPIHIDIGSMAWCEKECAKILGFTNIEDMRDRTKILEYRRIQNDKYAIGQGYKDWDDLIANIIFKK